MQRAGARGGRRWAGAGAVGIALGVALVPAPGAEAARLPPRPEVLRREIAPSPRFQAVQVRSQQSFTERRLLEFEPRELGGPAIDPFSGEVALATRRGELYLLDSRGRQVWMSKIGAAPSSSPTVTDDAIYVGTVDGNLHALDRFNGEHLWTQPLGGQVLSPPVARADRVFVGTDHDSIHALEPSTGEVQWLYRRSTPANLTIRGGSGVSVEGNRVFAGFSDGAVVALGAEDGRSLWQAEPARGSLERFVDSDAAPLVRNGLVYTTVFNDGVYAYDAATGKLRWRADAVGAHSLSHDGELLLVGGASRAWGLNLANGAFVWSLDLGDSYVVKPVVHKGIAMLAGPKGIALVASDTGKPLGRFFPGSGFSAGPVAMGSEIYAFSDLGYLYRLSLLAGRG